MNTKVCSKCNVEKEICEFRKDRSKKDGLYPSCKRCKLLWRQKNKELTNLTNQRSRLNCQERIKKYNSEYQKKNKDKINTRSVERRKSDPLYRLSLLIRSRMYNFLKYKNVTKKNKTSEIVGCSLETLKLHIENQFTDGMSWELMGKHIHIDHIIPLSSAKTEQEILKLCHYTNLQPLWAKDNLKKHNKIIEKQ
jgi:hypothetical protein